MHASRVLSMFVVFAVLVAMVTAKKHKSKNKKKTFTTTYPIINNDFQAQYKTKTLPASIFPTLTDWEYRDSKPLKDGQVYLSVQNAGYKL